MSLLSEQKVLMRKILIVESTLYKAIAELSILTVKQVLQSSFIDYVVVSVTNPLNIATAINLSIEFDDYEGVVVLGCIIQDDIVAQECLRSINDISLGCVLPVGFGIMITQSEKEAIQLSEKVATDAVYSCLQLINIKNQLHFIENDRYSKYRN